MTLPMAAWRVTYTPGSWLVLSGPTMLVVMLPAPARMSGLVNSLWADIADARSVDGLLALLNSYGLDSMPDFGAFFWDANGLHGIARGRIKVTDTDTGEVAVDGEQTVTWREENLGAARHLRIDMEPVDQDEVLQLPLVVGAASASAVYLTTHADEQIRFPSHEQLGVLPKVPVLGVRPRPRRSAPEVEDVAPAAPVAAPAPEPAPQPAVEPAEAPEAPAPSTESESLTEPTPVEPAESAVEPDVAPEPVSESESASSADADADAIGTGQLAFDTQVMDVPIDPATQESVDVAPPAPEPVGAPSAPAPYGVPSAQAAAVPAAPAPTPSAPSGGPVVVPGGFTQTEPEDDGGTIFSTGLAATHKPAAEADSLPDPQVLAVPCANGHANAPGTRHCRLCKAPVDSSNARLIRRPALAGVHSNKGEFADIVAGVLVGRSPDASKAPAGSYLMRVPSPSSDISRNHVLVTPRDWSVVVTDLHSTNGTTVMPVGEQPFVLANGDTVQVELGTVLDLGDGVSLRIEPPRG
ncbi:hypothetical protein GCM10028820_08060 [Tessaracoccus terricola]